MKKVFKIRRADGLYALGFYGSNKPAFDKNGRIFISEKALNEYIDRIYLVNNNENMFKDCVVEVYENTSEYSLD